MPLNSSVFVLSFTVQGRPPAAPGQSAAIRVALVTPDFLSTLAVPLLRGRSFTDRDRDGASQVVLLNQAAARRFFPGEEALGKRIVLGWSSNGVRRGGEVVGIVGDYRQGALEKESEPQLYVPFAQAAYNQISVVLRTAADPSAVSAAAREQVRQLDAALPLDGFQALDEVVTASASQPRFYMLLLGGFAVIALVLAAVGIYGVITYAVRQRTQEIGIRMALGATRQRVQRMVVGQGLILAGLGAAAGLAGALFATRGMRSLLYQVSAADPAIYLAVTLVLVLVAALAAYLPARRAARTEPQLAIRGES
jgi:putative ABC transport system permease protein